MTTATATLQAPPDSAAPPPGGWLEAYVRGNQEAFIQLVRHTTPLVMSAALRRCGGRHALAEEAAQVTFVDLARRAPGLRADGTLTGWLHQRATRAAADLMKQEHRRTLREQRAAEPPRETWSLDEDAGSARWDDCREQVDDALSRLRLDERTAVLLRCAEGRDFESVGSALGCSAEAARKKVARALEKVRGHLARHRTGITAVIVATGLANDHAAAAEAGSAVAEGLARTALKSAGPLTAWSRAVPGLKALGTGAAAAAALWVWPVSQRLRPAPVSPAAPTPVKTEPAAAANEPPRFPAIPAQLPLKEGLSVDELAQRIAALVEGPNYAGAWERFTFYFKQIKRDDMPAALRKLRQLVSKRGWHEFMKRDWAEQPFAMWAARDAAAALDFAVGALNDGDYRDAEGTLMSTMLGNLIWQCCDAACQTKRPSSDKRPKNSQAVPLARWALGKLAPAVDGTLTPAQNVVIYRGRDLARSILASGEPQAISLLIDLVNQNGFDWLDNNADFIKSKETLATLLELLPRLDSPARRNGLQMAVLGRLSKLDLPEAVRQVEAVADPAQRWTWADKVARPSIIATGEGKPIIEEHLKPQADWWLRQAPPGQEQKCAKKIANDWLQVDPGWAVEWMASRVSPEAAVTALQEVVKAAAHNAATFGPRFWGERQVGAVDALKKLDPNGAKAFLGKVLEENAQNRAFKQLEAVLKP